MGECWGTAVLVTVLFFPSLVLFFPPLDVFLDSIVVFHCCATETRYCNLMMCAYCVPEIELMTVTSNCLQREMRRSGKHQKTFSANLTCLTKAVFIWCACVCVCVLCLLQECEDTDIWWCPLSCRDVSILSGCFLTLIFPISTDKTHTSAVLIHSSTGFFAIWTSDWRANLCM